MKRDRLWTWEKEERLGAPRRAALKRIVRPLKFIEKKRKPRLLKMGIGSILALAVLFIAVEWHIERSVSEYIGPFAGEKSFDAVIVLGARVYSNGTVSPILADRLDAGIEAYESGFADKLLLSGDHGRKEYDEVNGMKAYVAERNLPQEDIFLDHAGFNTYDSIFRAKRIFKAKSILISTQAYHLKRAVYIARRIGLEAWGIPADRRDYPKMAYYELREKAARIKDFIKVNLLKSEPRYLGEDMPITGDGRMTWD